MSGNLTPAQEAGIVADLRARAVIPFITSPPPRTPFPDPVFVPSLQPVDPMSSWVQWVTRNEATFRAHPKFASASVEDIAAELASITRAPSKPAVDSTPARNPNRAQRREAARRAR